MTSRCDWLRAGQDLLRAGGLPAVKLAALTRQLGVTTGSFYHHFSDMAGYLDALADFYGGEHMTEVRTVLHAESDPVARLQLMRDISARRDIAALDVAMRVWATHSDRARVAVAALDSAFLALIRDAFTQMGFSADDARLRALVAFSTGIGTPLIFGDADAQPGDGARVLDLLTADKEPEEN